MVTQTPRLGLDTYSAGEDNWSHTDAVEWLDEHGVDRGPLSERPSTGEYDGEPYLDTDNWELTAWDADASSWETAGAQDTRVDLTDGSTSVTDPTEATFAATGAASVSVADDGDGSATVEVGATDTDTQFARGDVTSTSHTASAWDSLWVDTGAAGGAVTITTPADADVSDGDRIEVGVEIATNDVDVVANTNQQIIGSNPTLTQRGSTVTLEYKASNSTWMVR